MKTFTRYMIYMLLFGWVITSPKSSPLERIYNRFFKQKNPPLRNILKVTHPERDLTKPSADFSFIKEIAGELFPVLKNLN
jgi:hypothetical protein